LRWVTIRQQTGNDHQQIRGVMWTVKWCSRCRCNCLFAYRTFVSCFIPTMNECVVFTGFTPCGVGYIRA
jgi:hypothetical protein